MAVAGWMRTRIPVTGVDELAGEWIRLQKMQKKGNRCADPIWGQDLEKTWAMEPDAVVDSAEEGEMELQMASVSS